VVARDVGTAKAAFRPLEVGVFQAPLAMRAQGIAQQANFAQTLLGAGYGDAALLSGVITAWREIYRWVKPDVVVAQYGPSAVIAAKSCSIPVVNVGSGFEIPPDASPMPLFRDWGTLDIPAAQQTEREVLATINQVLAAIGTEGHTSLADCLRTEVTALTIFPELDHYGGRRVEGDTVRFCGPIHEINASEKPAWPGTRKEQLKVFAYLKTEYSNIANTLKELDGTGASSVVSLQGAIPQALVLPKTPNLKIHRELLDWNAGVAEADVVICHAGIASTSTALLAAKPVILLPTNAEQYILARTVDRLGLGTNIAPGVNTTKISDAIHSVTRDQSVQVAAKAFSKRHGSWERSGALATLVDLILSCRTE
jgi:UDP:flavonoid glycosyltransferase YjiC (YdhE family)